MIFRGAIYAVKTLPGTQGQEQQGKRFGVIIQSDGFSSSTVTVALAGSAIYRPEVIIDGTKTRILPIRFSRWPQVGSAISKALSNREN